MSTRAELDKQRELFGHLPISLRPKVIRCHGLPRRPYDIAFPLEAVRLMVAGEKSRPPAKEDWLTQATSFGLQMAESEAHHILELKVQQTSSMFAPRVTTAKMAFPLRSMLHGRASKAW